MNKSKSKYFNTAKKMNLALICLLKNKPLEYITISELCKTAGVNRSTFYLHYENIGDLLDETANRMMEEFFSYFSSEIKSVSFNLKDCNLEDLVFISDEYLVPYLTYIKENKEITKTALLNKNSFGFDSVYKRMFESVFNTVLDRFKYPKEDRTYIMMYYLNGINAIVFEWIKDDCTKSIA